MKIQRKSAKTAIIRLLGGVTIAISLALPTVVKACPYYESKLLCHVASYTSISISCHPGSGLASKYTANGFVSACISAPSYFSGSYLQYTNQPTQCAFNVRYTNSCDPSKDTSFPYGFPITHTVCGTACGG